MDQPVTMQPVKKHVGDVLPEVVGTALDVGEESVQVDESVRFHVIQGVEVVAFQGGDQEERIRIDAQVGLRPFPVIAPE